MAQLIMGLVDGLVCLVFPHLQVVRDNFKLNAGAKPEDVPRLMSHVSICYTDCV